ncbi:hypothetical protein Tco_1393212 [Tanacetum coccineum]
MDEEEVNKRNDLKKEEVTVKISCDTVVEDVADRDTVIGEVTGTTYGLESEYSFFRSFPSPGQRCYLMMSYDYQQMEGKGIGKGKVISMESQMIHVESHEIHIESRVIYLESNVIHIDQ